MTNPGHFVVIQGFVGGRLVIVDPGNELMKKPGTTQNVGHPAQSQWPGGQAPAIGYESDIRAYVSIDPTDFVAGLIRMEQYICKAVSTTTTAAPKTTTAAPVAATTAAPAATTTAAPVASTTAAPAA